MQPQKYFSFGCHPLEGVTGAVCPLPSDATDHSDSRKHWLVSTLHWYCDDVRLHCSFTAACCLIFELTRLILAHFVRRGTAGAQAFSAGARAPAGPGLAPPLLLCCECLWWLTLIDSLQVNVGWWLLCCGHSEQWWRWRHAGWCWWWQWLKLVVVVVVLLLLLLLLFLRWQNNRDYIFTTCIIITIIIIIITNSQKM